MVLGRIRPPKRIRDIQERRQRFMNAYGVSIRRELPQPEIGLEYVENTGSGYWFPVPFVRPLVYSCAEDIQIARYQPYHTLSVSVNLPPVKDYSFPAEYNSTLPVGKGNFQRLWKDFSNLHFVGVNIPIDEKDYERGTGFLKTLNGVSVNRYYPATMYGNVSGKYYRVSGVRTDIPIGQYGRIENIVVLVNNMVIEPNPRNQRNSPPNDARIEEERQNAKYPLYLPNITLYLSKPPITQDAQLQRTFR